MSDNSKIEWTDATWSPVTGCTKVSPGCEHCYIERTPPFRTAGRRFTNLCPQCRGDGFVLSLAGDRNTVCDTCNGQGSAPSDAVGAATGVLLHHDRLAQPLRWRKPRKVFVCSMADLFHDDVPDGYVACVFTTMAMAPQHTFQVLTKRPARMRSFLTRWYDNSGDADVAWSGKGLPPMPRGPQAVRDTYPSPRAQLFADMLDSMGAPPEGCAYPLYDWAEGQIRWPTWPLPNVWVGVSAESQQWANVRIPVLLDTPAAVRWVSAEPLLGPLILDEYLRCGADWLGHECSGCALDWVVAGGESGPGARPMHPDWARSLRDQCAAADVPFLFKQWGEWAELSDDAEVWGSDMAVGMDGSHARVDQSGYPSALPDAAVMRHVGKKAAGRVLDGRTWDEYPK